MEFYVVRVPDSKGAVSPAGYFVIPSLYVLTLNSKQPIVPELVNSIVVKLDVVTVFYPQPVSMPVMHIHIAYGYVLTIKEINYVIVSFTLSELSITVMIHINLKPSYYNVIISGTVHLLDQWFHCNPACIINQFDHSSRITFKNSIAAD